MRPRGNLSARTIPWLHAAVCKQVLAYLEHLGIPYERCLEKHHLPLHEWNEYRDVVPRHLMGYFLADVVGSQGVERFGWETVMHARRSCRCAKLSCKTCNP